jgi:hypothetical protein
MAATKPAKQDRRDPPLDPEFGVIFVLTTDEDVEKFVGANQNDSRETTHHGNQVRLTHAVAFGSSVNGRA